MNLCKGCVAATLSLLLLLGCEQAGERERLTELETDLQRFSYSMGVDVARNMKGIPGELDFEAMVQGIEDTWAGEHALCTEEEALECLNKEMALRRDAAVGKAKEEGVKFLEENGKRSEVTTTASGLQYEVLSEGSGAKPVASSMVTVHYTGTLTDGTTFDSSKERGEPATFPLNGVISGWTEGLQLMSPGASYRFFIPAELGYGERGAGNVIPPGSTLIFDVDLISFE